MIHQSQTEKRRRSFKSTEERIALGPDPNRNRKEGFGIDLRRRRRLIKMGFAVTTLIFAMVGVILALSVRICCNKGPSANLLHLTLVVTAAVCCWLMWAIVYLAQLNPLIVPILSEAE